MIAAPRRLYSVRLPSGRVLELGARCLVVGIVNVTPDSFAEPAPHLAPDAAVDLALRLEDAGADVIDVGGESTRPGAEPVPLDVERARVLPVIDRLVGRVAVPLSIDTYKPAMAAEAVAAGASLVNDVHGLQEGPALAERIASTDAALVLMHTRGTAKTMAAHAEYGDVVGEVAAELRDRIRCADRAGVAPGRIIVDPGIGFAKRPAHSYGVLARLAELAAALDRPVLVGPSRKSFLRTALGDEPAPARDWGTAAAIAAAVLGGAHLVRVHAVREMVQVVKVAEEIRRQA